MEKRLKTAKKIIEFNKGNRFITIEYIGMALGEMDKPRQWGVNWCGLGTRDTTISEQFSKALQRAIKIAKEGDGVVTGNDIYRIREWEYLKKKGGKQNDLQIS